jgi:hypothetical protein
MEVIGFHLTPSRYSRPAEFHQGVRMADKVEIFYGCHLPGAWRFVVANPGKAVCGATYGSKDELLAALPGYAKQWGF